MIGGMPKVTLIPVTPITTKLSWAFVTLKCDCPGQPHDNHDGGLQQVPVDVFPENPLGDELRDARVYGAGHVHLGAAARRLGITVVEMSGLERGRFTLSEVDHAVALELLTPGMTDDEKRPRALDENA